jgi:hypothetical protein
MAAPSYQTAALTLYPQEYREVADAIYDLVSVTLPPRNCRKFKGSYSVFGTSSAETAAKILIYDPQLGKTNGKWPHMRAGVYVLVRANGKLAKNLWDDSVFGKRRGFFAHMLRNQTIGVAPKHMEQFCCFPVVAGDKFADIAAFLVDCSHS